MRNIKQQSIVIINYIFTGKVIEMPNGFSIGKGGRVASVLLFNMLNFRIKFVGLDSIKPALYIKSYV